MKNKKSLEERIEEAKDEFRVINRNHAELSSTLEEAREPVSRAIENLESDYKLNNSELIQLVGDAFKEKGKIKEKLRKLVEQFRKEEDKKGKKGKKSYDKTLSVRVSSKLVYEEDKAIEYVLDKGLTQCLRINRATFGKVAKALELDFVSTDKTYTLIMSKELSEVAIDKKEPERAREEPVEEDFTYVDPSTGETSPF